MLTVRNVVLVAVIGALVVPALAMDGKVRIEEEEVKAGELELQAAKANLDARKAKLEELLRRQGGGGDGEFDGFEPGKGQEVAHSGHDAIYWVGKYVTVNLNPEMEDPRNKKHFFASPKHGDSYKYFVKKTFYANKRGQPLQRTGISGPPPSGYGRVWFLVEYANDKGTGTWSFPVDAVSAISMDPNPPLGRPSAPEGQVRRFDDEN